ncbi:MAG: S8 family serine peptidase [Candidatus Eisenbacteria bacterium]
MTPHPYPLRFAALAMLLSVAAVSAQSAPLVRPAELANARSMAFRSVPRDEATIQTTIDELADHAQRGEALPRVWVYFRDKEIATSDDLVEALWDAEVALDPREADRRERRNAPLDFYDLPIPADYLSAVEALGKVHRISRWLNAASVLVTEEAARQIAELPFVAKIVPVRAAASSRGWTSDAAPNQDSDSDRRTRHWGDPFDYGLSRPQLEQINVIAAHAAGLSGNGVVVAMFDTGFFHDHLAFQQLVSEGRLLAQYDFINDDEETQNEPEDVEWQHSHGTATWSALGGFYPGELVGPAYGATFVLAKTEDVLNETPIEEDNWVAAAEWASGLGAEVISSSLTYVDWYQYEDMDGDTAPITIAADLGPSRGLLTVSSAGNLGAADWYYIGAPADGDSVLSVGAVDLDNQLAYWSSHGPTFDGRTKPDVVALGVDTYCGIPNTFGEDFYWSSGTSLSCPLVGGAAALLFEARPTWSPIDVRDALRNSGDSAKTPDNDRGWGLIDVMAALSYPAAAPGPDGAVLGAPKLRVSPNPGTDRFRFEWRQPDESTDGLVVRVFDATGREVARADGPPGASFLEWDGVGVSGSQLPAGVYLARVRSGDWEATSRVVKTR